MINLGKQLVAALLANENGRPAHPPEAGIVLWNAFCDLGRTRGFDQLGPRPIAFTEIEAWCRLMRTPLEPHHIEILIEMDDAWMKSTLKLDTGAGKPPGIRLLPQVSAQPISPALFDLAVG